MRLTWRKTTKEGWGPPPKGRDLCRGGERVARVREAGPGYASRWYWYGDGVNTIGAGVLFDTQEAAEEHCRAHFRAALAAIEEATRAP